MPNSRWLVVGAFMTLSAAVRPRHCVAQTPAPLPLVVNVRVIDTAGATVPSTDVAIIRGINDSRATGTTDASGRVALTLTNPEGDYQLVIRKIGYNRTDQFFRASAGPLSFNIVMHRTTQTLAPVEVTAQEDLKKKSYFIDADEIAKHADELIDASDIIRKLKPNMICGRSCRPLAAVAATARTPQRACPTLALHPRRSCPVNNTPPSLATNVWVNGVWISSIAPDTVCQMGRRGMLAGVLPGTMQVLCEIRPEHIEQMTYADEFDTSVGKNHSDSALFIALKPGVAYQPGAPSYVMSDSMIVGQMKSMTTTPRAAGDSAAPRDSAATLPVYRYRVLGVFDDASGDPIRDARVTEANSGTYAVTTPTGTVTLVFLPEGSSSIRITKAGYEDLTLTVDIGPTATTPLTLLMKKKTSG